MVTDVSTQCITFTLKVKKFTPFGLLDPKDKFWPNRYENLKFRNKLFDIYSAADVCPLFREKIVLWIN